MTTQVNPSATTPAVQQQQPAQRATKAAATQAKDTMSSAATKAAPAESKSFFASIAGMIASIFHLFTCGLFRAKPVEPTAHDLALKAHKEKVSSARTFLAVLQDAKTKPEDRKGAIGNALNLLPKEEHSRVYTEIGNQMWRVAHPKSSREEMGKSDVAKGGDTAAKVMIAQMTTVANSPAPVSKEKATA